MYVCVCNAVTDKDIRGCVDRGASSLFDVQNELPVGSCCGRCQDTAQAVVNEYLDTQKTRQGARVCTGPEPCCRIAA
jgi:bacterioferritin-associated ferredoxin